MSESFSTLANKTGFHYFQDTTHYTNKDLNTWLPELVKLSAGWLVLLSDSSRAIPENFIHNLASVGINPLVHFRFRLPDAPTPADMRSIFEAYSHWGVKYVVLFDKPNQIASWSLASWSQLDLVERFIDRFLPLANEALRAGLIPVFPPLEPGGDYWDTSFLRSALESIKRRGYQKTLNRMAFTASTYTFGRDLSWGAGGPQKWTAAKPYMTPDGCEDQCGFNNWQWIESIVRKNGIESPSIFQFYCGLRTRSVSYSPVIHAEIVQEMKEKIRQPEMAVVKGSMFWLLAAETGSEEYSSAWIKADGKSLPIVKLLANDECDPVVQIDTPAKNKPDENPSPQNSHPIDHYLLLPRYEWGVADWHLEVTRPFVIKHHPTVGYSLDEASLAKKVTVIGGDLDFPPDAITHLRNLGCDVEQISGDGTTIATTLAMR